MREFTNKIVDKTIREKTLIAIDNLPDYFWVMASSTTGKYHPSFSLGEGGLVRHTKFAVEIALGLFNISKFNQTEKDCIISALLLHDGMKCGNNGKHTDKLHPIIMRDFLNELWKDWDSKDKDVILNCIASHMGKWDEKGALPIPNNEMEEFVHKCDYLGSRKLYDKYYKGEI